ncbi:MAG: hypothetical protein KIG88_07135 [Weeksellaceae bacterium]|nr:hypothetical protein [Weeksellaceae bacterium]
MSSIHNYYITSQLFQLIEERVASVEVEKKLRPIAAMFVRLFDDIDFNISNELVAEALEKLIFFVHKDGITSTVEFSQVEKFFTDEDDQLFLIVKGETYQVVEPAEVDEDENFEEEAEGVEYEENAEISLDDEDSYIVVDGDEIIEEYELNEEITLDDEESYLVMEDEEEEVDDNNEGLAFTIRPIILDNAHAELITLAATTDLDELLEEQIDDLPAFKEILDQLEVIRKEVKKKEKEDKKSKKDKKKKKKSKKKKDKNKKDKKSNKDDKKKDLTAKIAKKLHNYVIEKELEQQLLIEFVDLKKQIDYIVIQY